MKKLLVANRGEIALRIMRSAREMGIKTVAVFSDADRNALHVRFADEAVYIGASPSNQSYLLADKIIDAARHTGADAIHPGYGFLSENADFSDRVTNENLIFVGPTGDSMRAMGSKLAAKATAKKHNIPLVPGTDEPISNVEQAKKIAAGIGFPVLLKASAGGGGKGMRVVNNESEFEEQLLMAQSEAKNSFGDDAVFIERYVSAPRHIEIQILGDKHGNVVHLFERECSIQRRHQKLVEEAPCCTIQSALREAMGACAVQVAKACNYYGAGTVEFLMDEKQNFYFLEMNTRLQVEHPVTELITGLDLVKEMINIARGEKLSFSQKDVSMQGHAIEIRVCAEDPQNNFLPDIGKLITYNIPQGHGIRVDDSMEQGMEIPIYYDPLIAKLIVHAATREQAMDKMIRAIDDYTISGVLTTLPFCKYVMQHPAFRSGNFDTNFVKDHFNADVLNIRNTHEEEVALAMAVKLLLGNGITTTKSVPASEKVSNWKKNRMN